MQKPRVTSGRRFKSVENLHSGNFPAHRTAAHAPVPGTLAFSSPGCHVLSLTGPFLMLNVVKHKAGKRSKGFCVINLIG